MVFRQISLPAERLALGLLDERNASIPHVNSALVRRSPEDIARQFDVRFDTSWDDLDYLSISLLRIDGGPEFALVRHRGSPVEGTEIWLHAKDWNRPGALEGVLAELNIPPTDLIWRLPLDFARPSRS